MSYLLLNYLIVVIAVLDLHATGMRWLMLDALELTRRLVRIDTTNPPGNEDAAIDELAPILSSAGFEILRHRFAPGRSNLVAVRTGATAGPSIAFTGHVDTVPLGDSPWTKDPFGCTEMDGRIYGRGVTDMKAGVAAMVSAAVDTSKNSRQGVVLVITGGEERGCEGAEALKRDKVVLPPIGGWIVGEPTGNRLALGHKGAVFANIEWRGRTAHSAMPEQGDNAIYRACGAALRISNMSFAVSEHPVLGFPTKNVGMLGGGQAPNTVPDRAWLSVDVRTVPSMSNSDVVEQLRSLAGENSVLGVRYDLPAIWTDAADPFVERCRSASAAARMIETPFIGMPFFTDASVLISMAPAPVVIVGPGEPTQAHKTDEWCPIDDIRHSVDIYSRLMTGN